MPSVKRIHHHKDGVDIDFTVPIDRLVSVKGISRLSIAQADLTPSKLSTKMTALDLKTDDKYGFKVEFMDDPSVPPNTLIRVVDKPPPKETDSLTHNTPVFLDGFESRDFGPWVGQVGGQAEVQSGTVIDGGFTAHFGYSGGPGSDQGECSSPLYGSTGVAVARTRTYTIFRARITAFAASSSGSTGICNHTDGQATAPHLQITEDGKISVSTRDTVYTGDEVLSLDTTYWFGYCQEIDTGSDGWVLGRVWDEDGVLLDEVGIESPTASENLGAPNWTHVHVGAFGNNTPCEIYIDSVYSDDGDDWPPLGKVSKTMHPVGPVATDDDWSTVVPSGDKWLTVDDLKDGVVDDTDYVEETTSFLGSATQGFNHVGFASAGIPSDATIHAVLLFPRYFRVSGGTNAQTQLREGANVIRTNVAPPTVNMAWQSPMVRSTHPDGGDWSSKTPADLDDVEIGMHILASFLAPRYRLAALHFQAYYTEAAEEPPAAAFVPRVMMF